MASDSLGWEPQQLRDLRAELLANPALAAEAEGTRVLATAEQFITKYVILPAAARLPIGLWAISTHLADGFDSFPTCPFRARSQDAVRRARLRCWNYSLRDRGAGRRRQKQPFSGTSRRGGPHSCSMKLRAYQGAIRASVTRPCSLS
jgi:hypothetical protein